MKAMLTKELCVFLMIYYDVVHAQEAATGNQPVVNKFALGGMVHGLLDMQIRPQGGFYEERYKELFPEIANPPLTTTDHLDRVHNTLHASTNGDIISEDGNSLAKLSSGNGWNPCFDEKRILRNRLLLLMCSLQLKDARLYHRAN